MICKAGGGPDPAWSDATVSTSSNSSSGSANHSKPKTFSPLPNPPSQSCSICNPFLTRCSLTSLSPNSSSPVLAPEPLLLPPPYISNGTKMATSRALNPDQNLFPVHPTSPPYVLPRHFKLTRWTNEIGLRYKFLSLVVGGSDSSASRM